MEMAPSVAVAPGMLKGQGSLCPMGAVIVAQRYPRWHLLSAPLMPVTGITNWLWMSGCWGQSLLRVRNGTYRVRMNCFLYWKEKDQPEVTVQWHPARRGEPSELELTEA